MKDFPSIVGRILQDQQIRHPAPFGKIPAAPFKGDAVLFERGAEKVHCRGVRDLPTEEAAAVAPVFLDMKALLAVVHRECRGFATAVNGLQASA
ncbi:hypothetical protein GIY56_12475 [Paracoccus sp. YIM 132242]|uniref:Uncharacterized protein n=1 Tax=Paracoccus lichenicola TaxID=2665644 RepID=A0A6L6HS02_9RHOB|nr:hypothetical protein [Paracoccus lichenicola]MTE01111.1 hypothetical protein [Paracoccus lichenicola]